jgi:hypothetical protein
MSRYEKMRFETGVQKDQARFNVGSIKKRYGYR